MVHANLIYGDRFSFLALLPCGKSVEIALVSDGGNTDE